MRHVLLILILIGSSAFAEEQVLSPDVDMGDDATIENQTVESLMIKKNDILLQTEKIEQIQSAIGKDVPDLKQPAKRDKNGYTPLTDEDPQTVQSVPPFQIDRNN